ncbi:hypothetical protein ACOSP7_018983 [Xanthoceras sorbifolium]
MKGALGEVGPSSTPRCDESTSRCQTTLSIRALGSHQPVGEPTLERELVAEIIGFFISPFSKRTDAFSFIPSRRQAFVIESNNRKSGFLLRLGLANVLPWVGAS